MERALKYQEAYDVGPEHDFKDARSKPADNAFEEGGDTKNHFFDELPHGDENGREQE